MGDKKRSDSEPRPKPEDHPDLSDKWVGAGHLKVGDKLKQADGTLDEFKYVNTIQEARTMCKLEVEEAHTFFVGTQGWLVHNQDGPGCFNLELRSYYLLLIYCCTACFSDFPQAVLHSTACLSLSIPVRA
ncbi:hypothetical protein GCM10008938_32450 [Deinococcus roseus]|uniref:Intein C-terminal splicing domain-containing protein n=1 Tax=Deinococcus roseus TaxID=392414 RepID=A0ABQ2D2S4_9DEIO|nr:hypothetical protein GCM10008938_32450 [Deinococcus roseus]